MFPGWEQNIPRLGMKRSQVGNKWSAFGGVGCSISCFFWNFCKKSSQHSLGWAEMSINTGFLQNVALPSALPSALPYSLHLFMWISLSYGSAEGSAHGSGDILGIPVFMRLSLPWRECWELLTKTKKISDSLQTMIGYRKSNHLWDNYFTTIFSVTSSLPILALII